MPTLSDENHYQIISTKIAELEAVDASGDEARWKVAVLEVMRGVPVNLFWKMDEDPSEYGHGDDGYEGPKGGEWHYKLRTVRNCTECDLFGALGPPLDRELDFTGDVLRLLDPDDTGETKWFPQSVLTADSCGDARDARVLQAATAMVEKRSVKSKEFKTGTFWSLTDWRGE